ncbi:uncharacterized protein LOC110453301 [Mizuhopecten yessoensis]|uniref:uncharacterized protein LOC110453301 n=1 Tax=Mizuhopecten yessoensis TaxID=6573 RepID=UPI000B457CF3|nr:uncharacterized protein LOC110453301 [Mizuhopecten yessoensis]
MAELSMLPLVQIGDRVKLCGEEKGEYLDISNNLGFRSFEIRLESSECKALQNITKWGDVAVCTNREMTKTRPGSNPRNVRALPPRAWSTPENPSRCPVVAYNLYKQHRPDKEETLTVPLNKTNTVTLHTSYFLVVGDLEANRRETYDGRSRRVSTKGNAFMSETSYTFSVATGNDAVMPHSNQSQYSLQVGCQTKAAMSLGPSILVVSQEQSRQFTPNWAKPTVTNGDLWGYILILLDWSTWIQEVIFTCTSCTGVMKLHSCSAIKKNIDQIIMFNNNINVFVYYV